MQRKTSSKALNPDEKLKRNETKTNDNEYYLPHPQIKILKINHKDIDNEI
jgi:hypothetical protein